MTRAEDMYNQSSEVSSKEIVEEVFGEIKDLSVKIHPNCDTKTCAIEDNREKKASDSKYAKIPDFACGNYGDNEWLWWLVDW